MENVHCCGVKLSLKTIKLFYQKQNKNKKQKKNKEILAGQRNLHSSKIKKGAPNFSSTQRFKSLLLRSPVQNRNIPFFQTFQEEGFHNFTLTL